MSVPPALASTSCTLARHAPLLTVHAFSCPIPPPPHSLCTATFATDRLPSSGEHTSTPLGRSNLDALRHHATPGGHWAEGHPLGGSSTDLPYLPVLFCKAPQADSVMDHLLKERSSATHDAARATANDTLQGLLKINDAIQSLLESQEACPGLVYEGISMTPKDFLSAVLARGCAPPAAAKGVPSSSAAGVCGTSSQ